MAEWYYIGHYGQLGPLTREQVDELVEGGVITPETYVWRSGMLQWQTADSVSELQPAFQAAAPFAAPPPPPMFEPTPPAGPAQPYDRPYSGPYAPTQGNPYGQGQANPHWSYQGASQIPTYSQINPYYRMDNSLALRSDKSRTLAGVLQLFLPGVGRMYLGYYAYGTLQLVLTFCTGGVLWLWPIIDGIIILSGGLKFDGFGRVLTN